jgi:hypothetical protein
MGQHLHRCRLRGRGHCQHSACGAHGEALTRCQLRREREHCQHSARGATWGSTYTLSVEEGKGALSAFSVRCAWGSTYTLSVEGKGAFVSIQRVVRMGQHLHTCRLRRGRQHLSAFSAWIRQHPPVTIPLLSVGDIPSDYVKLPPHQAPFQSLPLYPNLNGLFGP